MKRAFIRALWGVHDKSNRILKRRYRTDLNMNDIKKNQFNEPFITYVFGEENFRYLKNSGFDNCILLTKEPNKYDLVNETYRHKLEILRYAMEEDGYDEIVHMDWDCIPTKKLSVNFWNELGAKESFQACLMQYKRDKCPWRKIDQKKVPNGGYCYIRKKEIPSQIIKIWGSTENENKRSCEPAMGLYLDKLHGEWIGVEKYLALHEPMSCILSSRSVYKKDKKDYCFIHYAGEGG
jgi:hypothetical protein